MVNIYEQIGYYLSTGELNRQFVRELIETLQKRDAQILQMHDKIERMKALVNE